jgi:hypothetical protein
MKDNIYYLSETKLGTFGNSVGLKLMTVAQPSCYLICPRDSYIKKQIHSMPKLKGLRWMFGKKNVIAILDTVHHLDYKTHNPLHSALCKEISSITSTF